MQLAQSQAYSTVFLLDMGCVRKQKKINKKKAIRSIFCTPIFTCYHILVTMASQAQKHSGGQTSDDVKSLRTKVRQMEERIIELEKAVERIDVLEERLAQISLSHDTLQNEDRKDYFKKTCIYI